MKDERYDAIKSLIESKKIVRLEQWFKYIPKTNIAKDAGIHPERFNTLINHVERFSIAEMHALSNLIEIEYAVINDMLNQQYLEQIASNKNDQKSKPKGLKGKRSKTM